MAAAGPASDVSASTELWEEAMPRLSFRRSALVAVAAPLVLVGTACGVDLGDDVSTIRAGAGDGTSTTVVLRPDSFEGTGGAVFLREATEATRSVDSQKVSMTIAMDGVPMLGDVEMRVDGAFDNRSGRGTMTLDMSDFLGGLLGGGDKGRIEMIVDGETVYMKSPLFSQLSGSDKPWLKGSASDFEQDGGSGMAPGMGNDPAAYLDFLKATGDGLEEVGREDVRGVSTTHLRTNLDLEKLMAEASADEKAELEKDLSSLGDAADLFDSIPADVWIDDDGYVRKTQFTFDFSELPAGAGGDASMQDVVMTMTVELYDFNEPVEIELPDPAEVGELDASVLGGD